MGYGWSYTDFVNGIPQESEHGGYPTATPRTKEYKCDSHHLFCWGHEMKCDYYEEKKR